MSREDVDSCRRMRIWSELCATRKRRSSSACLSVALGPEFISSACLCCCSCCVILAVDADGPGRGLCRPSVSPCSYSVLSKVPDELNPLTACRRARSVWDCAIACVHNLAHNIVTRNNFTKAPCGLRGCKNGPAPFPGRMSYKATKPGLVCLSYLSILYYCIVVY